MVALVRSELHRMATVRSTWLSLIILSGLGLLFGVVDAAAWQLLAGVGTFGLAAMHVGQHYQHRTAVLLHLAQPNRALTLVGHLVAAVVVALVFMTLSGVTVLLDGDIREFRDAAAVVPLMAVFAAANAAIFRRPTWLFLGYGGWFIFVEGLAGRLDAPLPFSAYLAAGGGDRANLLVFAGWTGLSLVGALFAVRRDLVGD
ncbi:hypothetical protein ACWENR_07790 [Micromonospora sp. NPDC004336]